MKYTKLFVTVLFIIFALSVNTAFAQTEAGAVKLEAYVYTDPTKETRVYLQDDFNVMPGTTVYYKITAQDSSITGSTKFQFACDLNSMPIAGEFAKLDGVFVADNIECLYEIKSTPTASLYIDLGEGNQAFDKSINVGAPSDYVSDKDIERNAELARSRGGRGLIVLVAVLLLLALAYIFIKRWGTVDTSALVDVKQPPIKK